MCWCKRLVVLTLLFPLAASPQTNGPGGDAGGLWMLMLSAMTDENSYENFVADYKLGITDATWLSLTAGSSRAPSAETDVAARLGAIGIDHDFGPVELGLSYDDWGDPDNLESSDLRAELAFGNDDFRLALIWEQRDIDIFFSGAGAPSPVDLRRLSFDVDGFGLTGRYRLAPEWQVYGALMSYDYPRLIRAVPRADRLNLLSTSAVSLAYSFVDEYVDLGFERSIGSRLFSFSIGRDRSAIDRNVLESVRASMLWPIAARLDLEFSLGRSRSDLYGGSTYGGLSLMIYGG